MRHDTATGLTMYWCARCKQYFGAASFMPSSIRRYMPRCRACRCKAETERKRRVPAAAAAHALTQMAATRHGLDPQPVSTALVQRILDRSQGRSALSGQVADASRLRIRPFWPDLPLSEWNAVVVTANENKSIGRSRQPLARFPEDVLVAMRRERQAHLQPPSTATVGA